MRASFLPLVASCLLAAGCLVVATQPPEPAPGTTATADPSAAPDAAPTAAPTATPTATPTAAPTAAPTATPTAAPTAAPTSSSSPGVQTCGSRGLAPCPSDQFCNFPAGSECGATDRGGACQPMPQACTRDYRPVCGCDGQTYSNACSANAKGVSVAKEGKCN